MGPSGSGKTTTLNILSGRITENVQGTILFNDQSFAKTWKHRMGFLMQDNVLYPHLTVRETLTYAALLKLPKSFTKKEKVERAKDVIYELGLDKCQDIIIGEHFLRGISGGEKRRLCMGHEILTNPSLLFADEPTSGLDSTAALCMMQSLCDVAKSGRTVIASIHQPSSRIFHLFDKLLLFTDSGQLMYFGKAADALTYFSDLGFFSSIPMNPADFLLDLASGYTNGISLPLALFGKDSESKEHLISTDTIEVESSLQEIQKDFESKKDLISTDNIEVEPSPQEVQKFLVEAYESTLSPGEKAKLCEVHNTNDEVNLDRSMKKQCNATWIQQVLILLVRGIKERKHEYFDSIQVSQLIVSSFIIGIVWRSSPQNGITQDQMGLLFFTTLLWGYNPAFLAIFAFPREKAMLAKERASGMYKLSAYFIARSISDLPLELLLLLAYLLIVYFMTHLSLHFITFFQTLFGVLLHVITAQSLGLAVGACFMDLRKAVASTSVIVHLFTITGGYFLQQPPPFISWLKYFSFNYHTFKLLIKIQFHGRASVECITMECKNIMASASFYKVSLNGGAQEVWSLLLLALGYRLIAYKALQWRRPVLH